MKKIINILSKIPIIYQIALLAMLILKLLLKLKLRLQKKVHFGIFSKINFNTYFEGNCYIYKNVNVQDSHIGYGTYIAFNSHMPATKIGRFCSIGENVRTGIGNHPLNGWVTTHPAFFSTQKQAGFSFTEKVLFHDEHKFTDETKKYVVEIGNDVWIGNNVCILDGIKVGDGAVIALGSIVTKDVEPYTVVAGIPAKPVKKRFSEEQIEKLMKIKWWNWDIDKIKSQAHLFNNIDNFLDSYT